MTGIQFPHTALTTKKLADIKDIIYMLPTCWAYYIHTVTDKTSVIWHSMYYGTYHTLHSSASTAEYVASAGT